MGLYNSLSTFSYHKFLSKSFYTEMFPQLFLKVEAALIQQCDTHVLYLHITRVINVLIYVSGTFVRYKSEKSH